MLAEHRKLREQEVAGIAAYLWTQSEPAPLLATSAPKGDAARGKELFDSLGCRGCHIYEKGATARRSEGSNERDYAPFKCSLSRLPPSGKEVGHESKA